MNGTSEHSITFDIRYNCNHFIQKHNMSNINIIQYKFAWGYEANDSIILSHMNVINFRKAPGILENLSSKYLVYANNSWVSNIALHSTVTLLTLLMTLQRLKGHYWSHDMCIRPSSGILSKFYGRVYSHFLDDFPLAMDERPSSMRMIWTAVETVTAIFHH